MTEIVKNIEKTEEVRSMDKKLGENMPIYVQIMNSVKEAIAAG